jgi:hypothetical protein
MDAVTVVLFVATEFLNPDSIAASRSSFAASRDEIAIASVASARASDAQSASRAFSTRARRSARRDVDGGGSSMAALSSDGRGDAAKEYSECMGSIAGEGAPALSGGSKLLTVADTLGSRAGPKSWATPGNAGTRGCSLADNRSTSPSAAIRTAPTSIE